MSDKSHQPEKGRKTKLQMQIQIFIQFALILSVVIFIILISSNSFYIRTVQSINIFELGDSLVALKKINLESPDAFKAIQKIELDESVHVEIYKKNNPASSVLDKTVYAKYYKNYYFARDNEINLKTEKLIDYKDNKLEKLNTYKDGSVVGISENNKSGYRYFTMAMYSDDGKYLYVSAINYSEIEDQAQAIQFSAILISFLIFVVLCIVIYFYITRITQSLRMLDKYTRLMAETNNKNIRIPTLDRVIRNEMDQAIDSINELYESLILSQEALIEKSQFLASQLDEKENEQKNREQLVAGISHELKTPIAIIQGYAEGISYVKDDEQALNEYCETIVDECRRMTDLVVDMMSLSNVRHSDKLNYTVFSIKNFVDERLRLHDKVLEKNGISVYNDINENIFGHADTAKLQFVINNLLSNAISYIGGEPKIIRIRYEEYELAYRIFVFNSGNQIPQDDLQKLWDSFYRRDAARLRTEGHFGLGLSIVKSVQDAHSQQCGVDNAEGGVEFWFDIAKADPSEIRNQD